MIKSFLSLVNSPRFIKYSLAIFFTFWTVIFISSLMSKSCYNEIDPRKKITYCNLAIGFSFPLHPFSYIKARMSFEKGITYSKINDPEAATKNFSSAIEGTLSKNYRSSKHISTEENPAFFQMLDLINLEGKKSDAYINFMSALDGHQKSSQSKP